MGKFIFTSSKFYYLEERFCLSSISLQSFWTDSLRIKGRRCLSGITKKSLTIKFSKYTQKHGEYKPIFSWGFYSEEIRFLLGKFI